MPHKQIMKGTNGGQYTDVYVHYHNCIGKERHECLLNVGGPHAGERSNEHL